MSRVDHSRQSTQVIGAVGIAIIAVIVSLLVATYNQAFVGVKRVELLSDRSGLLLDKGARVRLAGVPVGEVRGTSLTKDGNVSIDLAIDDAQAANVPADVTASIRATTVFGSKFVDLEVPPTEVGSTDAAPIASGAVLHARHVTVEVNDVFEHAIKLLKAVDVGDLSKTLTAADTALRGRGDEFGSFFKDWNDYLKRLDPHLDELDAALKYAPAVLSTYADALPGLIQAGANFGTTSKTLVDGRDQFEQLLRQAVYGVGETIKFTNAADGPLRKFDRAWLVPGMILAEFSPEFGCVVNQLHAHIDLFNHFLGGGGNPYFYASVDFLPGQKKYTLTDNRVKFVHGIGPRCYAEATAAHPMVPHIAFDDGTKDVYSTKPNLNVSSNPLQIYNELVQSWLGDSGLATGGNR